MKTPNQPNLGTSVAGNGVSIQETMYNVHVYPLPNTTASMAGYFTGWLFASRSLPSVRIKLAVVAFLLSIHVPRSRINRRCGQPYLYLQSFLL